jgi:adenosylhomocysteine nucleosidase
MIFVTFAVPQESRDFVGRLRHSGSLGPALVGNLELEEVAVLHTGMGGAPAREVMTAALADLRPRAVVVSGFAGGLDASLEPGQLIAAENLSDSSLLRLLPSEVRRVRLTSVEMPLDTPADKARVRTETGAEAVDLESTALTEICAARHIPVLVLRIVSDAADEPLPLPSDIAYDVEHQRIRPFAIFNHLGEEPAAMDPLARFAHRLPMFQRVLADAIAAVIKASGSAPGEARH